MPRIISTPNAISWSAAKKKSIAITAKTSTMTVEIMVSRREGQVTFAASDLTCWRKVKGFVVFDAMCRSAFKNPEGRAFWMIPKTGRCRLHVRESPANQQNCSNHTFLTRKAGFPAPRAACPFCLHKVDSRHMQAPSLHFMIQTPHRNHPIVPSRLWSIPQQ